MNKKVKNTILYAILFVILFISTFSKMFDVANIWEPDKNVGSSFNGIYFEKPSYVSNMKVVRSLVNENGVDKLFYDIEFVYSGQDSNMRIIGDVSEQAFFGDGVVPKHSNVTLKDQYDDINTELFNDRLVLKDYYKKTPDYNFKSSSSIRVPLNEEVNTYKFRLTYTPRYLVHEDDVIAKTGVFLTNARVDQFTHNKDAKSTDELNQQSFSNAGMTANVVEAYDSGAVSKIETVRKINNVIFTISVLAMLALIWLSKKTNEFAAIGLMFVTILTFYKFFGVGVAAVATYTALPLIAFIAVLIGKQMPKKDFKFNKYDFSQALVGAVLFCILSIIVFVLPGA